VVDLHPAGFGNSRATAVAGATQVGWGAASPTFADHALLWNGSAATAVDLNPTGFTESFAMGVFGGNQVGYGAGTPTGGPTHALLWSGTAASYVDLHPAGFGQFAVSSATAISGATQVGNFYDAAATANNSHAMLWTGSAASAVDLNPPGFEESEAWGVSGAQQVGWANGPVVSDRAILWNGTAASAVNLHPSGFISSNAYAISGNTQVGEGQASSANFNFHAIVWNGTASSAVDLHPFLSGLGVSFVESTARAIADNGTIVGYAHDANSKYYAVMWTPIPEPGSCALVCYGLTITSLFSGRRGRSLP
jgi:hypothetical protein